jgi:hypothetical protein
MLHVRPGPNPLAPILADAGFVDGYPNLRILADNAGNRQRGSGIRIERDQDLGRDLDL